MISVSSGGPTGPSMGFRARNLRPLAEERDAIEADLRFSNNERLHMVAKVLRPDLIQADVPPETVLDFANATSVDLRVKGILVGRFSLSGTHDMVLSLGDCVRAMKGEAS